MIHTFGCSSCGAPVNFDDEQHNITTRCDHCGNSVIIPEHFRGARRDPATTHINLRVGRQRPGFLIALVLVLVFGSIIMVLYFINTMVSSVTSSVRQPPPRTVVITPPNFPKLPTNSPDSTSGFASAVMKFGGEGTGPGMFTDARSIGVDGEGRIYVADYLGGRVQVFDSSGKFITQWMVDPEMPLRGMTADRSGNVYIVQRGIISRYEGATGKPLGQLSYPRGNGFDDITATADGGFVAAWDRSKDNIVRFDREGKAVNTIEAAISSQSRRSELNMRVAVDGLGNIYALGTFNSAVFKFAPDGKYITRFGSDGDQPGQFRAPDAIAVDGQGRVYVSDFHGVQVFAPDGRYLDRFPVESVAFGMVFNDKNELLVAARHHVIKYTINK